jgi:hypothetical protein
MAAAAFIQEISEIFEKLHMSALVRSQRYRLNVLFDSRFGNFMYTSVVTQMNDFDAFGLQDSSHDIDGGIVPVEKGSRRYDS